MSSVSVLDAEGIGGEPFPQPMPVQQTTKTAISARRVLADELRAATELQSALLPRPPSDIPGYAFSAATRSAGVVSGDYYDFLFRAGTVHFAIGDVSGSGMGAAMLATALRALVRAFWLVPCIEDAVRDTNRAFQQSVPDDKFATLFVGRIDTLSGQVQYVNAGHEPGLLVRASGEVEKLSVGGTVVGGFSDAKYETGSVRIEHGDTLLITSDGISELWANLDASHRRLAEIVRSMQKEDVESIKDRILMEIGLPHVAVSDDSTLLVIRRKPSKSAAA